MTKKIAHTAGTMESMLNKLKNTVTKVTADVTSAVMGNPVTREFDVGRHIASGGNGLAWKIFHGTKKSTKQEVAVFVFDKKLMDKYQKFEKDQIIDCVKRGVQQLTRLRHPRLLTVQHPLEESRDCLAFCTEPVFASLANVLGNWDNLPSPVPSEIKEHKLYDVETKYGLLQVSEGLAFLHSSVKMIHANLTPENIILNKNGAWKIMGFDFCNPTNNPSEQEPKYLCKEWDPNLPALCLPNPEYLAPEYILSVSCETVSDMYSLGVVIHAVFNKGKPIFEVNKQDIYKSFSRQLDQLSRLSPNILANIPEEVKEHLKLLLNVTPAVRPDADQMTKIPFFDDVGAMTLQYFDSLFQRDNLQKSQFFKGLPKVLPKLPKRVVVQRILPFLTSEFVNPDMVPFVLPNVLLIAEECTKEEYVRLILPELGPVFKQQEPIQILLIFLQKMDLLLTKTPPDEIKNSVLPMVYRALEAPSIQIQELCLTIIPTFANLIEYPSMKNALIPRIKNACLQTSSLAVRVNALVCLGKILEYLDKWYVLDEILPFLQQIPSREPAVLMGILGIYKCTFTHKKLGITKEQLAGKVLPHLVPLSIDNNLNLNQFNSFMSVIKDMLSKLETEHKVKLEQLHIMQEQQKSLNLTNQMNTSAESQSDVTASQMDMFSSVGPDLLSGATDSKENGVISKQQRKASLTLEEKQKLAKEQEQAQKLKSQQPLQPKSLPSVAPVKQAKDLTSTLMENKLSLNSLAVSNPKTAPPSGFSSVPSMGASMGFSASSDMSAVRNVTNGFNSGMGFQTPGFHTGLSNTNQNVFGGSSSMGMGNMNLAATSNMPNFHSMGTSAGPLAQIHPVRPTAGLSSLDNLFGPQKAKVSMNQMSQQKPNQWLNQFASPLGPQGMSGSVMATPMNTAGQADFALQGNPFFNPQNFTQPANTMKSSSSASNDLKDLFG
ncbi:SCY1-like protein 2 [Rhinatrema bivittatum]|uniref:SCY1-like protein 2 n=1 Tax=Rhinatrema bivittatum TaxID=194408 RepID=UPI001128F729|nr:SCY1-like protein 2 [Rhinatrema bivittatum]XP_029455594.1 SCY1-like protein 2 [Rhinatrema bivittatum]XP_029455595.1 SCY1-like protein 2 [Rhinatrema bivittatum]